MGIVVERRLLENLIGNFDWSCRVSLLLDALLCFAYHGFTWAKESSSQQAYTE
jgi:hypothetical protein